MIPLEFYILEGGGMSSTQAAINTPTAIKRLPI
jgi:hypothetical protein